ncbi:hypothetical protein BTO09_06485 [Gilvibacter sp. SZ-19]|uniref:reverse transcriptase family protein n=1 Tax=Gilvibacter sp. SZ-19 TaxID=754429 RepID=UPI000B3CEB28|nr:reverse transcriptase family protein [Gilvibacter sp. SZ-19]ARV12014.1 hypothetical protein BTO09_06485 [Gilvibacter sp. SZ-19]
MKLNTYQTEYIRDLFANMSSKKDFLFLLNKVKELIYKEKTIAFSEQQLNYYINLNPNVKMEKKYFSFSIEKKSGGTRTIHAPSEGLKEFQKAVSIILSAIHQPHDNATGFIQNRSIVNNARKHIGKNYVYNIDLKDFFPSIDANRVWARLLIEPFNLGTSVERKKIANMIKAICCTNMEVQRLIDDKWESVNLNVLPQGASTSPVLTNIICDRLDKRLTGVAKRFGLNYTRYADDITFSSNHNVYRLDSGDTETIYTANSSFDREVRRIIVGQKFHVKESKVRLQKRGYRQEVTGLTVNEKVNVPKRYIKEIRHWIYFWERYGYDKATELFRVKYRKDKGHIKNDSPNLIMVLEGKLLYLKMVKGEYDPTYVKLRSRFRELLNPDSAITINLSDDNYESIILDTIFSDGLDEAMKEYDPVYIEIMSPEQRNKDV